MFGWLLEEGGGVRKIIFYIFVLAVASSLFMGCTNTLKGVHQDIKDNWNTLKRWDSKMQEEAW